MTICFVVGSGCKSPSSSQSAVQYTGTYFTGTAYACSDITPKPANEFVIAVTEANPKLSPRLKCTDQWSQLDWNNPPWEKDHWLAKIGRKNAEQVFLRFPQAFRLNGERWLYNQPDCTTPMRGLAMCGTKVAVSVECYSFNGKIIKPKIQTVNAVVYDACPANHWNNAIKDDPRHPDHDHGVGNPCKFGSDAVDVHKAMWTSLGVPINATKVHFKVIPNVGSK